MKVITIALIAAGILGLILSAALPINGLAAAPAPWPRF
jgi:hypothetical protein